MKRHIVLAAAALAFAASVQAGPLGVVSGGAGGGLIGGLGGTLSGAGQSFGMGAGGALSGAGQFNGQIMPPQVTQPDLNIDRGPLNGAVGTVNQARGKVDSKVDTLKDKAKDKARDTVHSISGSAAAGVREAVSAGAATPYAAGQASTATLGRASASGRGLRNLDVTGAARTRGDASLDAGPASADTSVRADASVKN